MTCFIRVQQPWLRNPILSQGSSGPRSAKPQRAAAASHNLGGAYCDGLGLPELLREKGGEKQDGGAALEAVASFALEASLSSTSTRVLRY